MSGAGSRNKGAIAEREVAGLLEAWWWPVEPGIRFVRAPLSGGWHGPDVREQFQASGDIMTTAKHFPFTVEVKRRESGWTLDGFAKGKGGDVWRYWWQAQAQAAEMKKEPMLWLRKNRQPWLVVVRHAYTSRLPSWIVPAFFWSDDRPPLNANPGTWTPAVYYAQAQSDRIRGFLDIDPHLLAAG